MHFSHNVIAVEESADTNGCWGAGFGPGGYTEAGYSRNAVYDGNTFINTGNNSMPISSSPDAIIRNNLFIFTAASVGHPVAITISNDIARTSPADDKNTRNTVVNNTIWFGPNVSGATCIAGKIEGAGHILANNTATYESSSSGNGMACFGYQQLPTSYAFINNNHCFSAGASPTALTWEASLGTLESWTNFSGFDFASVEGAPNFVNATSSAGNDFRPNTGSPLIGAGSHANTPTTDILGKTRTSDDIGAYQH
jgi:hypothetical protein